MMTGWERVEGQDLDLSRLRVPSGWLYHLVAVNGGVTTTFVPDAERRGPPVITRDIPDSIR
jgi:hypothetical protein